jgi:hypothetical protein
VPYANYLDNVWELLENAASEYSQFVFLTMRTPQHQSPSEAKQNNEKVQLRLHISQSHAPRVVGNATTTMALATPTPLVNAIQQRGC